MKKPINILLALGIGLSFGTRMAECNCATNLPETVEHLFDEQYNKARLFNAFSNGISKNSFLMLTSKPDPLLKKVLLKNCKI